MLSKRDVFKFILLLVVAYLAGQTQLGITLLRAQQPHPVVIGTDTGEAITDDLIVYLKDASNISNPVEATVSRFRTSMQQGITVDVSGKLDTDLGNVGTVSSSDAAAFRTAIGVTQVDITGKLDRDLQNVDANSTEKSAFLNNVGALARSLGNVSANDNQRETFRVYIGAKKDDITLSDSTSVGIISVPAAAIVFFSDIDQHYANISGQTQQLQARLILTSQEFTRAHLPKVTADEITAGTSAESRAFSPQAVHTMIDTHAPPPTPDDGVADGATLALSGQDLSLTISLSVGNDVVSNTVTLPSGGGGTTDYDNLSDIPVLRVPEGDTRPAATETNKNQVMWDENVKRFYVNVLHHGHDATATWRDMTATDLRTLVGNSNLNFRGTLPSFQSLAGLQQPMHEDVYYLLHSDSFTRYATNVWVDLPVPKHIAGFYTTKGQCDHALGSAVGSGTGTGYVCAYDTQNVLRAQAVPRFSTAYTAPVADSRTWLDWQSGIIASLAKKIEVVGTPSTGQVPKWDGSKWTPQGDDTGGGGTPVSANRTEVGSVDIADDDTVYSVTLSPSVGINHLLEIEYGVGVSSVLGIYGQVSSDAMLSLPYSSSTPTSAVNSIALKLARNTDTGLTTFGHSTMWIWKGNDSTTELTTLYVAISHDISPDQPIKIYSRPYGGSGGGGGTTVTANPGGTGNADLNSIGIDGTNYDIPGVSDIPTALSDLTGILAVSAGGTGAGNVADARSNLGLGSAATRDVTSSPHESGGGARLMPRDHIDSRYVNTASDTMTGLLTIHSIKGASGDTITTFGTAASHDVGTSSGQIPELESTGNIHPRRLANNTPDSVLNERQYLANNSATYARWRNLDPTVELIFGSYLADQITEFGYTASTNTLTFQDDHPADSGHFQGDWSADTTYEHGDLVEHHDRYWIGHDSTLFNDNEPGGADGTSSVEMTGWEEFSDRAGFRGRFDADDTDSYVFHTGDQVAIAGVDVYFCTSGGTYTPVQIQTSTSWTRFLSNANVTSGDIVSAISGTPGVNSIIAYPDSGESGLQWRTPDTFLAATNASSLYAAIASTNSFTARQVISVTGNETALTLQAADGTSETTMKLTTNNTGSQKAFQANRSGQNTAWASFEGSLGGSNDKPGLALGPGTSGRDVRLYRDEADVWRTPDSFHVGELRVDSSGRSASRTQLGLGTAVTSVSSDSGGIDFTQANGGTVEITSSELITASGAAKLGTEMSWTRSADFVANQIYHTTITPPTDWTIMFVQPIQTVDSGDGNPLSAGNIIFKTEFDRLTAWAEDDDTAVGSEEDRFVSVLISNYESASVRLTGFMVGKHTSGVLAVGIHTDRSPEETGVRVVFM